MTPPLDLDTLRQLAKARHQTSVWMRRHSVRLAWSESELRFGSGDR